MVLDGPELAGYDAKQVEFMEEKVIIVDENDAVVRAGTKKECHLNENIEKGLLHRAFSVFLFNSEGKLLLQQRSDKKITFPLYWANTCCSHPLFTESELESKDALGVKRAAVRKLGQELGIEASELPLEKFTFLARIHYVAMEESIWGEHEIDHVLIIQADVKLNPEPNEVKQVRYFSEVELAEFLQNAKANGERISPWFGFIQQAFLAKWWKALRDGCLEQCQEPDKIYRMNVNTHNQATE